ncbi:unnamed protein product [Phytomonas sp. Hart1]|nr:unnamed protein product [Phytomonas sp. Hart1]|eukprot:CCW68974.1 unnamed protein product [Phytomonas sp. isolate Hart1]
MSRAGFDQYITVFSPEGSLYQVEYAFKAVAYSGLLTVAVQYRTGVLVVTQHQVPDRLMRPSSVAALFNVADNIGCCMTGRAPDGRAMLQRAREEASEYHSRYGLPIPIQLLAKRLGDKAQVRTQQAGLRPMGVIVTLIGMDQRDEDGAWVPRIFTVDPAGWVGGYHAVANGKKDVEALAFLEKRQKSKPFDELDQKEAAMIALAAVQTAVGASLKASDLEVGVCTLENRNMALASKEQVEDWLTAVAEAD